MKLLYELKEKYNNSNLYVWKTTRDSNDVFTWLCFYQINITGFCEYNNYQYADKKLMNRPIKLIDQLNPGDVVLYSAEYGDSDKDYFANLGVEYIHYDELFDLNSNLKASKSTIIFRAERERKHIADVYQKYGLEDYKYCNLYHNDREISFTNKPIIPIDQLADLKDRGLCVVYASSCTNEIVDKLRNIGINENDMYFENIFSTYFWVLNQTGFCTNVDKAIKECKKFILYGVQNYVTGMIIDSLALYGINFLMLVDDEESEFRGEKVSSVFELMYYDIEELYVIVNKNENEYITACNNLDGMGFSLQERNYIGFNHVGRVMVKQLDDIWVGHVAENLINTSVPGFFVYGNKNHDDYKIVTLGGSTTTEGEYRVESWPSMLYKRLTNDGYQVTIYNGGVSGFRATNEAKKIIRDVSQLYPDLIISFSGVNNIYTGKREKQFRGKNNTDFDFITDHCFEWWLHLEKTMNAIACSYGSKFLGFLQPILSSKEDLNFYERLICEYEETRENSKSFRKCIFEEAEKYDKWLVNLIDIFDMEDKVYIDSIHASTKGNMIITDNIYKHVVKCIKCDNNY